MSSFLFSTTELFQLLKVPVLVSHFIDHNKKSNMNFLDFMSHHYRGHKKDADRETDMKLPFMRHSDLLQVMVITPKNIFVFHSKKVVIRSKDLFSFYKEKFVPSLVLPKIWQPPRLY